ncbi:MAG: S9 family peptidase, partial [Acidimicrobiales bacterium]
MTELPFGEWPSPISAASLVRGAVGIGEVVPDGEDVWWAESRPSEGGRTAVMRWRAGRVEEITPSDAYVRTLVHEYGGGAWWVHDGVLFYADLADQRLRRLTPGGEPLLLTPVPERERGLRYADGRTTPDGRWYVCVRERHEGPGAETEAVNELVAVATDGSENVVSLWRGSDFVMSPRLSAAGDRLAWIAWDHPDMPWDSTELWTAEIGAEPRSGAVGERLVLVAARVVAGNGDEALCEPGWGPDGELYVVSDRHEWWNLHRVDGSELVAVVEGDFEVATPPWVFGMQRWAIVGARTGDGAGDGTPVVVAGRSGGDTLVAGSRPIDTVDRTISSLHATPAGGLVVAGSGFGHETEVVRLALADGSTSREVLRPARDLGLDPAFLTPPEPLSFPTGGAGDARAHALLYRPAHPEHRGPADSRPPLMVLAHGG